MADINALNESDVSEMVDNNIGTGNESHDGPPKKMRKTEHENASKNKGMERLENRLGGILCCAVCLDLPNSAVYQVSFAFKV